MQKRPQRQEIEVARYRIGFYNNISDSTGHERQVCQREVEIVTNAGENAAIAEAIRRFEKRERISHWKARARHIECTRIENPDVQANVPYY